VNRDNEAVKRAINRAEKMWMKHSGSDFAQGQMMISLWLRELLGYRDKSGVSGSPVMARNKKGKWVYTREGD
jgi:hypothetical protein